MKPKNIKQKQQWKIAASLVFLALLFIVSSASAQLTVTGSNQFGAPPFTPSWTVVPGSLLSGLAPTTFSGNSAGYTSGSVTNLTAPGNPLTVAEGTNMVTCGRDGNNAVRYALYTLPASTYGQNITNITVYGGWDNAGRDGLEFAVLYSTVADPTRFFLLTTVNYNPPNPGTTDPWGQWGQPDATQVAITDASGGPIATNVACVKFDFAGMSGENNASGYTAISLYGAPATGPVTNPVLTVAVTNENGGVPFTPDYTVATDSLIAGISPSTATGDFTGGGNAQLPSVLTDGNPGVSDSAAFTLSACGAYAGQTLIYTLTNSVNGSDVTNIVVYNGWGNDGRCGQYYTLSYSTVTAPTTFIPITTAYYFPDLDASVQGNGQANRVTINNADGTALAKNIMNVKFDFLAPPNSGRFDNGWQGYGEIVVEGTNSAPSLLPPSPYLTQDTLPAYAETVVGDQAVFTAACSNGPPSILQWQVIKAGVTNNINTGVVNVTNNNNVSSTLTLNNVQLTDSSFYLLKAVNATNNLGISYSSTINFVVDPAPAAVSNIVTEYAYQSATGQGSFGPTWDPSKLSASLIYGMSPSSFGNGDFQNPYSQGQQASGPAVLTDGSFGTNDAGVSGNHQYCTLIGSDGNAGNFVTYTLTGSAHGYDITNIVTAAGWENAGRDQQAYTVFYATAVNPSSFLPLAVVNCNPSNPDGISFDRATITPVTGPLASNVVALKFDMTAVANGYNGYEGYSEIAVYGSPSANAPTGPVVTAANEQIATPDWVLETPSLIAGQLPSSVGSGDFTGGSGCTGVSVLTDGLLGDVTVSSDLAACGSGAGTSVTYTPTNGSWNLTNIVVYSGWANNGRDGQFYNVSYSTMSAPATFVPLVSVAYNPIVPSGTPSANRVDIAPPIGGNMLATNVYAVQFDFTPQLGGSAYDNGWSGYAEIVLQGTNLLAAIVPTLPTLANPKASGGYLILTGTGGTANAAYTWLTTTNLSAPIIWTTNTTGSLDGAGAFSNSIPIGANPASFFRMRLP